jgi:hypothetical protein
MGLFLPLAPAPEFLPVILSILFILSSQEAKKGHDRINKMNMMDA